jgi:hypothetical protein
MKLFGYNINLKSLILLYILYLVLVLHMASSCCLLSVTETMEVLHKKITDKINTSK